MPAPAPIITGNVIEDSSATFLARIAATDGTLVTQASVNTISVKVFDLTAVGASVGTPVYSGNLATAAVIFNTLQTDAIWKKDSIGYNFKHVMPPAAFPDGNRTYQVEYLFVMTSGDQVRAVYQCPCTEIFGH